MAVYDEYGRLVVWDAAKLAADPLATIDDVVRIKNDTSLLFNVLWMRNNIDSQAETTLQPLAKYEDGAVKLYNTTDYAWYNVGCELNEDGVPTLYYSNSGLPTENARFTKGYWEIQVDSTELWHRVGTQINEDGNRELYVSLIGVN